MELKKEKSIKNNLSKKIQSWLIKAKQVKNLSNKNSISSSKAYNVKGITLIALVITIVILIILATITVNFLFGENGLINRAQQGTEEYNKSDIRDRITILQSEFLIDKAAGEEDDFANFLRKELQVGVTQDEEGNYNFAVDGWQVEATENEVISIERLNMNPDKIYPNVASMKADTGLTDGQLVQTESYWDKQYGGSAYYDIVSSTSLAVDDGKCIQLDNGLYAELHPINNTVTVNQYGAYGDGEHDDANSIQLALNAGYGNVTFESERYNINDFITFSNSNISILGNNARLIMQDGFQLSDSYNWAFFIGGTQEERINNVNLYNLKIETGNINFSRENVVQVQIQHIENLKIYNCEFLVSEIDGNKTRPTTNIWILGNTNNVNIDNCNIINLSNGNVGGNVWISDPYDTDINTIKISNNYIEKSSHDETIGIWDGTIKNIIIENNEFNIHEENVDNPSDMNFTFGNSGGILQNLVFSNNKVYCESKNYFVDINPAEGSSSISIVNNNIEWMFRSSVMRYNPVFHNSSDVIVEISGNNIIYNTIDEDNPGIYSFADENENFYNNNITINGKLQALQFIDNNSDRINTKFDSNNIIINTDIYWLYSGYYFCNNTVELKGFLNNYRTVFKASFQLENDVKILNNTIKLNNNNYETHSIKFLYCQGPTFNNHNIDISNNKILSDIDTEQFLIYVQDARDTIPQTIYCNNNNYNNFKIIDFYNNLATHKVIVNGQEITSCTYLE